MKKHTFLYIIFAAMLAAMPSCENFLDITPEGQVDRDKLLSTPEGIEDALYGAYSQLRLPSLYGQNLTFSYLEVMAQTLYSSGNTEFTALGKYDYEYTDVKESFEGTWIDMYKNISNVNSVINSPLISNATDYPYTLYRGEALGLRAFMHFDLMRLFCDQYTLNSKADGIPYQTLFSLKTPDFESLEKNYEHVIADLLEAERLLAIEKDLVSTSPFLKDRQTHFNLYAVQATLARVYLTMGNKEKAFEYAEKVIDKSGRELTPKEEVVGSNYGHMQGYISQKEAIFGVYYKQFYNLVSPLLQKRTVSVSLDPRYNFADIYEEDLAGSDDFRVGAYFSQSSTGGVKIFRLSKFTDPYELMNAVEDRPAGLLLGINLIRLPEMYYICAEALLESDPVAAAGYYDEMLRHRGITPLSERPADNVLTQERINLERYKEFYGEGQTFFNMKRHNLQINSADGEVTYDPTGSEQKRKAIYVVPIPDSEKENRY